MSRITIEGNKTLVFSVRGGKVVIVTPAFDQVMTPDEARQVAKILVEKAEQAAAKRLKGWQ